MSTPTVEALDALAEKKKGLGKYISRMKTVLKKGDGSKRLSLIERNPDIASSSTPAEPPSVSEAIPFEEAKAPEEIQPKTLNYETINRLGLEPDSPSNNTKLEDKLWDARVLWPKRGYLYFIPADAIQRLINSQSIDIELRRCGLALPLSEAKAVVTEILEKAPRLFAILVCQCMGNAILEFLKEGLGDEDLPFIRAEIQPKSYRFKLRSHRRKDKPILCMAEWGTASIELFSATQWLMLAPIFNESTKVRHYSLEDNCVLPFIEDHERQDVMEGGYSTVWPVLIHPAHQFVYKSTNSPNPMIALKRLHSTVREKFDSEVEMLKHFTNRHEHPHLVKLLATYSHQGRFYLMFPEASANLRQYWEQVNTPKFSATTVEWMLQQCKGIASGLAAIHNYRVSIDKDNLLGEPAKANKSGFLGQNLPATSPDSKQTKKKDLFGRHGDIKPENILISNEDVPDELGHRNNLGILLITDFGLMEFHNENSHSIGSPYGLGFSPTYEPPDRILRLQISQAYDIWSLGCVYLEFITWLVSSYTELARFPSARGHTGYNGVVNDDTFYTIIPEEGKEPKRVIVSEQVTEWILDLHEKTRCSQFVHEFVDLIAQQMLVVDPHRRIHCGPLNEKLKDMCLRAKSDPDYLLKACPRPPRARNDVAKRMSLAGRPDGKTDSPSPSPQADEGRALPKREELHNLDTTVTTSPPMRPLMRMRSFTPPIRLLSRIESGQSLHLQQRSISPPPAVPVLRPKSPTVRITEAKLLPTQDEITADLENLPEIINPNLSPETLKLALASGRFEEVKMLVDKHLSSVAKGDFIWLLELREHSYTAEEISQLLVAEQNDSPWIYFEPRELPREAIIPDHHQLFCVHTGGQDIRNTEMSISSTIEVDLKDHRVSWTSDDESLSYIEEFCGLAGVVPNTRDLQQWVGSVQFEEEDGILTASVSFRSDLSDGKSEGEIKLPEGSDNTLQVLENLCNAISYAQRRGMCCNCFTFLCFNSDESGQEVVELCQIRVTIVLELLSKFKAFIASLRSQSGDLHSSLLDTLDFAKRIFQKAAALPLSTTPEGVSNNYSVLAQLLTLAFSSYIKAHVGAFQPFFLDTPVKSIQLFGLKKCELGKPHMTASLYRLTCLDNMIQNPVLVFRNRPTGKEIQRSYDLLATPEDLVDTWGPGQFITSSAETGMTNLTAIMIGGGVAKPTAENSKALHWSNDIEPRHEFSVRFSSREKILIAGSVEVNSSCEGDKSERWSSFIGSLENLGTSPDYWKFTEFQAGVAVMGQQFAGGQFQFNKTWTWHPGNSWKRQYLSLTANGLPISELDRPWGLQVSACTGVARRVPLRILLADVMPAIAENLALPPGWSTLRQRGILTALEHGGQSFAQWYNELCDLPNCEDLQTLTRRLIRHVLLVLRDTGIDRDQKTFLIACPQGHTAGTPISMSLPVPCENASLWAKILTDSENCATFACMTTLCLESQEHKCQQTNPWHFPSLDTAVQQLRARKEPITIPPQSWNLEVDCIYWIGRPESGLQARVIKPAGSLCPRLYISKSAVPEKTRARLGTMGRLFGPKMDRLRERQINTWPAEEVLVLSQSR